MLDSKVVVICITVCCCAFMTALTVDGYITRDNVTIAALRACGEQCAAGGQVMRACTAKACECAPKGEAK